MKIHTLIVAAAMAISVQAFAADPVKFEIYLAGDLKQSVSLVGPNSSYQFSLEGLVGTTLEFKLIAPEPLILEMKETTEDGVRTDVVGRITMTKPGSSFAVSEIKEVKFKNPYVLVRRE